MGSPDASVSLWLVPAEPTRALLRTYIDQLALTHDGPCFEPHITLVSAEVDDLAARAAVASIATTHVRMDLVAGATGHGVDRFKALFVEFDDSRIHDLARALCNELEVPFDGDAFQPHVSLLYRADLPHHTRESLAAQHVFARTVMHFDTLIAMRRGEGIDDVARWQTIVARSLRVAS